MKIPYVALILAISIKDNNFYYFKEILFSDNGIYPENNYENIKEIISQLVNVYLENGYLPVDVCGILNINDIPIWIEPEPSFEAKLIRNE